MGQLDKDQLAAGSVQLWSPHRALSGAKAPPFLTLTQARMQTHTHPRTGKDASMRVGLAEISLMTLGREHDASSSSHPEPLPLNSQSGNTPGTCHHPSSFSRACGSPAPSWARAGWTGATDARQRAFRLWNSAAECNCLYGFVTGWANI